MSNLQTWEQIQSELSATASWLSSRNVALAKRRLDAVQQMLIYPSMSDERGQRVQFDHESLRQQSGQLASFIGANDTQSESERLANPSVLHADFSTFGQYGCG